MDLVNYNGERFGAASCPARQPAGHPVGACRTLPAGWAAGWGRNASRGEASCLRAEPGHASQRQTVVCY